MYAELECESFYSFLSGASSSEVLFQRASQLGLHSLAITDQNGVYGLPKAFRASGGATTKLICGTKLVLENELKLTILARSKVGYAWMNRLLTEVHAGQDSLASFTSALEDSGSEACFFLLPHTFQVGAIQKFPRDWFRIVINRYLDGRDQYRVGASVSLARQFELETVVTNAVLMATPADKKLLDVLHCTRHHKTLTDAGLVLQSNSERYLKSPEQIRSLFQDHSKSVDESVRIAELCEFSLSELKYSYPIEFIPPGYTAFSWLRKNVEQGLTERYGSSLPSKVRDLIEKEMKLVEQLGFADYFLTVFDIVQYARSKKILCQGRGSAANSVICYVLGITAVDPVRMDFLFERFLSAERGEPPDIDVDFEHERREEVIQYIYERYGRTRAAMVAAMITYQKRSAVRDVLKAFRVDGGKEAHRQEHPELIQGLIEELKELPRHVSIHSGGFVLSQVPLTDMVPVMPATMPGRTIIQWDKYDLDILGLLKIDVLSLGMLSAVRKSLDHIGLELYQIPAEDPATYEMMGRADTIGVFQIESRAQMSMLPRLKPKTFYDLVIEVALVRPGPIVGKMVHPFLRRRDGLEPVHYPDPRLIPILGKTLGVPIFQEQVMKIAVQLAGFSEGESDQLRRSIGTWAKKGSLDRWGERLKSGLLREKIPADFAQRIFDQIQGFSEYGFPESHAASFALIAYASAWLKCHHPAVFTVAVVNSQPMGFYQNHTLIDDVKRHGVKVLPLDLNESAWDLQVIDSQTIRLGFRLITGIERSGVEQLIAERDRRRFQTAEDFLRRVDFSSRTLFALARANAFQSLGWSRREALWKCFAWERLRKKPQSAQLSLFQGVVGEGFRTQLRPSPMLAEISLDYESLGLSIQGHPMSEVRKVVQGLPRWTVRDWKARPNGSRIRVAGLSIVMQRPPTAKGVAFATLEDETGLLDLMIPKEVYQRVREVMVTASLIIVEGVLRREGDACNCIVRAVKEFDGMAVSMKKQLGYSVR